MKKGSQHEGRQVVVMESFHRLHSKNFFCEILKGTVRIPFQCGRRKTPLCCPRWPKCRCADHTVDRAKLGGFSLDDSQCGDALFKEGLVPSHRIEYGSRIVALQQTAQGQFPGR